MALHVLILIALISATNLNPTLSQEWQQNSELSSPSESISVGENSINNFGSFEACGNGGSISLSNVGNVIDGVEQPTRIMVNGKEYNEGPVIAIGDKCVYHGKKITDDGNTREATGAQIEAINNYLQQSSNAGEQFGQQMEQWGNQFGQEMSDAFHNPNFPFGNWQLPRTQNINMPNMQMITPPCFCKCCGGA